MVRVRHQSLDSPYRNGTSRNTTHDNSMDSNGDCPDAFLKHATLEKIQENSKKIKGHLVQHAEELTDMLEELLGDVDGYLQIENEALTHKHKARHTDRDREKTDIQDKVFEVRQSLLTELFQISHIQSIYHIFVAGLVLLFLQTCLYDILETGWVRLDFSMIIYAFGHMQRVITVWLYMQCSIILLFFPAFHWWANSRQLHLKYAASLDNLFFMFLVIFFSALMYYPVLIILRENVPPASSAIIMCEQVRLVMKSYAFARSNWSRAKTYKAHQDGDESATSPCPDFGKFLYFLFAPTLVYRDEYPRSGTNVRWGFVASNLFQVVACLFYTYYVFQRFCVPVFRRFGKEPFSFQSLLLSIFGCMMPGTLVLLIQFYAVLHCWMNAFAEMLRFGDRTFYKDWWNSKNYSNYYRTWNVVVHDWLYTYIYRDMFQICKPDRQIPMLCVFMLSAMVHEYMVSLMFHFFYPILFFTFGGLGVFFIFLTKSGKSRFWNIFFWLTYFMGPGLLMTLYCLEIYARENCHPAVDSFLDFFIPRSWFCTPLV